ncbi:MAG: SDR family oxidoreductase [Planctomycetota bacterium]|nr:MAG: SDR family oxidoreductase [Planctomycetota bacterium]
MTQPNHQAAFLTGATGYIGGRLAPRLLEAGWHIRCLARQPRKLEQRPWRDDPGVEVVAGDMTDESVLTDQLRGCRVAYYLVHSMVVSGDTYSAKDRQLAETFARAASAAGVERIIYLGGLGELGDDLSTHLESRREVEQLLGSTGVPVTVLRAAMIIGSGSASFEILRYLVERLPVMVTPRWVKTESQPVAVHDVLHWLVRCLETPDSTGRVLEIGGPDILEYLELMRLMQEELGLPKRWIVPVPVLTPRLSSLWIGLVTPVSASIARPLAEGLRNRVVVTQNDVQEVMPHDALGCREAIRLAIGETQSSDIETRWSAAGAIEGDPDWAGGTEFIDAREIKIDAPPAAVFAAVCRVGGGNGWYAADILWRIRGWMDQLSGGPGLRRGRRHPDQIEFGEALDFWRVIGVERDRSLLLRAEMKLPGVAVLGFEIEPETDTRTHLKMTARFRPKGLLGLLYWYSVLPAHNIVFSGMLRGIRREAERMDAAATEVTTTQ